MPRRFNRRRSAYYNLNPEASKYFSFSRSYVLCIRVERYDDTETSEAEQNKLVELLEKLLDEAGYKVFDRKYSERYVYLYLIRKDIAFEIDQLAEKLGYKAEPKTIELEQEEGELKEEIVGEVEPSELEKKPPE